MIVRLRAILVATLMVPVVLPAAACAESWALVVGVNECPEFRLPDGTRPRALRGAESDADAFAEMLTDQFHFPKECVQRLQGQNATRAAVEKSLDKLLKAVQADDSFLFYFAGHGTQVVDQRPLDEVDRLDEALCLTDTTAEGKNLWRDDEMGKWLEACRARRITVVLDCCHAGTGIKDPADDLASRYLPIAPAKSAEPREAEPQSPWQDLHPTTKSLERRSLAALFACQSDQQAYERRFPGQKSPARSGQFTHFLLAALKDPAADTNGDGQLAPTELISFITKQLDASFNLVRAQRSDRQQPLCELSGDEVSFGGREASGRP